MTQREEHKILSESADISPRTSESVHISCPYVPSTVAAWQDGGMGLLSSSQADKKSVGWGIFLLSDGRVGAYMGPEDDGITVLSEKANSDTYITPT